MILNLQEKIILAKDIPILAYKLIGKFHISTQDGLWYLARHTGGQGDQPVMKAMEQLLVNTGLIIISLDVGEGY